MSRMLRTAMLSCLVVALLAAASFAASKLAPEVPPAPVPAQIMTAKNVFISNWGSTFLVADTTPQRLPYDELYAAMQAWGRYNLVATPAEADLILEIRYEGDAQNLQNIRLGTNSLRLMVVDPKTGTVLWGLTEDIKAANLMSTYRKNFDKSMTALVADLRLLRDGPPPPPPAKPHEPSSLF